MLLQIQQSSPLWSQSRHDGICLKNKGIHMFGQDILTRSAHEGVQGRRWSLGGCKPCSPTEPTLKSAAAVAVRSS